MLWMLWFKILLKVLLTVVFALQLLSLLVFDKEINDKEIKEEEKTSAAIVVLFMLTYFLGFLTVGIWTVL